MKREFQKMWYRSSTVKVQKLDHFSPVATTFVRSLSQVQHQLENYSSNRAQKLEKVYQWNSAVTHHLSTVKMPISITQLHKHLHLNCVRPVKAVFVPTVS